MQKLVKMCFFFKNTDFELKLSRSELQALNEISPMYSLQDNLQEARFLTGAYKIDRSSDPLKLRQKFITWKFDEFRKPLYVFY